MSGEHTPARLTPRRLTTLQWVQERLANTRRLAAVRKGADRDGWLEDAAYWQDIVSIIAAAPKTAAERDRLRNELCEMFVERDRLRAELEATRNELELTRYRETKLETSIAEMGERSRVIETQRNDLHSKLEREMLEADVLRAEKAKLVPLIAKIAAINIWRDQYSDGPDAVTADMSSDGARCIFTVDEIRTARAALAKATATDGGDVSPPQPPTA